MVRKAEEGSRRQLGEAKARAKKAADGECAVKIAWVKKAEGRERRGSAR